MLLSIIAMMIYVCVCVQGQDFYCAFYTFGRVVHRSCVCIHCSTVQCVSGWEVALILFPLSIPMQGNVSVRREQTSL